MKAANSTEWANRRPRIHHRRPPRPPPTHPPRLTELRNTAVTPNTPLRHPCPQFVTPAKAGAHGGGWDGMGFPLHSSFRRRPEAILSLPPLPSCHSEEAPRRRISLPSTPNSPPILVPAKAQTHSLPTPDHPLPCPRGCGDPSSLVHKRQNYEICHNPLFTLPPNHPHPPPGIPSTTPSLTYN